MQNTEDKLMVIEVYKVQSNKKRTKVYQIMDHNTLNSQNENKKLIKNWGCRTKKPCQGYYRTWTYQKASKNVQAFPWDTLILLINQELTRINLMLKNLFLHQYHLCFEYK